MPASQRIPVVFIHGLWLHASSWAPWQKLFDEEATTRLRPAGRTKRRPWTGWPASLRPWARRMSSSANSADDGPQLSGVDQLGHLFECRRVRLDEDECTAQAALGGKLGGWFADDRHLDTAGRHHRP